MSDLYSAHVHIPSLTSRDSEEEEEEDDEEDKRRFIVPSETGASTSNSQTCSLVSPLQNTHTHTHTHTQCTHAHTTHVHICYNTQWLPYVLLNFHTIPRVFSTMSQPLSVPFYQINQVGCLPGLLQEFML